MPADPSAVATATLAAHLLVESASGITRAGELLRYLGWNDDAEALDGALRLALRKVHAVRQVVDAHLENITGGADARTGAMLELAKAEISS
jgi:hypothetical protein